MHQMVSAYHFILYHIIYFVWQPHIVVSALVSINKVALHQAQVQYYLNG